MVGEKKFTIYSLFKYLFVFLFAFIIIYPLVHVLAVSLSDNNAVLTRSVSFYPKGLNFSAYILIFKASGIVNAYKNTIIYTVLHVILAMAVTTTGAYALSKGKRLWGFGFFTTMVLIPMFFNGGMIPTYITMRAYGLLDSTAVIVIMGCCSTYNLLVMKTFFQNIPGELEDAGRIDGLNDFGILFRIVLPLSNAIMTTIALFYAVGQWNSYMTPFIYLTTPEKWPVQILLRQMLLAGSTISNDANVIAGDAMVLGDSLIYATIIVSIIPMIVIYPFLQKYFVKGIMLGSIKG